MVVLEAADQGRVYVHRALLNGEVVAFGKCGWSCFPSATVASFVEYLYQGDYAVPEALIANSDASEGAWATTPGTIRGAGHSEVGRDDAGSTGQERREGILPSCAIGQVNANTPPPPPARKALDYGNVFLAHARLFILSQNCEVLPLASMCLKRLVVVMKEAQDKTEESILMENMHALTRFSYNPCCSGNDDVWRELQKTISGFLVSKKGWFLGEPTSDLIRWEGQLVKDVLAGVINLLAITDQSLIDKDKIIANNTQRLLDKNRIIASTYQTLMDKDNIIANTQKSLINKDKTIDHINRMCMLAQGKCEAPKTQFIESKSAQEKTGKKKKKNKRQVLTV